MRDAYERLGLSAGADVRDIRKAYARELKKIDQENDPEGFQSLREAYELALGFANGGMDRSPLPPPQATQEIPAPSELPEQLANTAWTECRSVVEQAAQVDESTWEHALHQALASDALTNLDARLWFEALVIGVLANGWRPGHETLFIAADKIFGWEESPSRLRSFHRAGALLARALDEKHLLNGMPQQERGAIRAAMVRLRDPRRPTANELELYSQAVIRLHQLFPTLASVTMNPEDLQRWREAKVSDPIISEPVEVSSSPSVTKVLLWLLAAAIMGTVLLPLFQPLFGGPKSIAQAPDKPVTRERLWEIGSRVDYRPKATQQNIISVEYEVFLDADRGFLGMNMKHRSGDKDFDAAVAEAIRKTSSFPLDTVSVYRAHFSLLPPGSKARPDDAAILARLPPGTVILPVARRSPR